MPSESTIGLDYSSHQRRRCDFDIIVDILTEAKEGIIQTRIMYKCNLSYRQLKTYLNLLLDIGLLDSYVDKESNKQNFRVTAKGLKFISAYLKLKDLMS